MRQETLRVIRLQGSTTNCTRLRFVSNGQPISVLTTLSDHHGSVRSWVSFIANRSEAITMNFVDTYQRESPKNLLRSILLEK